jgi:hypothetical protein
VTGGARRAWWLLDAVLLVLVVAAVVVLVRLAGGAGAPTANGVVDGTTPAVATARVQSDALKQEALAAAKAEVVGDGTAVLGTGIISVTSTDAKVLLFADTSAGEGGRVALKRLVATLRHSDAGWQVTALDPV